jgi:hypothetical protein
LYPGNQMENLTLKTWHALMIYADQANDRSTHGNWVSWEHHNVSKVLAD